MAKIGDWDDMLGRRLTSTDDYSRINESYVAPSFGFIWKIIKWFHRSWLRALIFWGIIAACLAWGASYSR